MLFEFSPIPLKPLRIYEKVLSLALARFPPAPIFTYDFYSLNNQY